MKRLKRHWKLALAMFAIGLILSVVGCSFGQRLNKAIQAFRADNPGAGIVTVDTDGDGTPEYFAPDKNNDGQADVDEAGKIIEIPGTRGPLGESEAIDLGIAEILTLAGAIIGIPGVGLVGSYVGRRKPFKQFTTLVRSFEAAKQEKAPEGFILLSKEVLRTVQAERPELETLIEAIRKAGKTV